MEALRWMTKGQWLQMNMTTVPFSPLTSAKLTVFRVSGSGRVNPGAWGGAEGGRG